MMKPYLPPGFEDRLDSLFDHRLRIRWSDKRGEWHIEYKVARGRVPNFRADRRDDNTIRAQDGYMLVIAVRTGDRMPCPKDGYEMKVPVNHMAETKCDYCVLQGRDGRYPAAYFDLESDHLFTYLKKLDPIRNWRDGMAKQADAANARLLAARERDQMNKLEAITKENYKDIVNIPTFGYGGTKTFT